MMCDHVMKCVDAQRTTQTAEQIESLRFERIFTKPPLIIKTVIAIWYQCLIAADLHIKKICVFCVDAIFLATILISESFCTFWIYKFRQFLKSICWNVNEMDNSILCNGKRPANKYYCHLQEYCIEIKFCA